MRIGIDIRALMEGKTTGVQVYITNLLHALFKLDQKNRYILFANSFGNIDKQLKIFNYPNMEYKIFHYPNKLFNFGQKIFHFPEIQKLIGRIDIFFSPHWRVLALDKKVPLVVTFHDLSFEIMPQFFSWRRRFWHKFMDYRYAAHRATHLVAVSESTKDDLIKFYRIPGQKISVIYSGVKREQTPRERGRMSGLPAEFFLFFGTFEPRKNLDGVLGAYEEYSKKSKVKLPLVLAGSAGWKINLNIPQNLKNQIYILQDVSEAEKTSLFQSAFALLFLSFYEGFGFPVLEAASFGVPVIGSFGTSLSEIGAEFVLFVNPFRSSQVALAMIALEEDQRYYDDLKERGLRVVSSFSWEKTAEQMLQLFSRLCVK